MFVKKRERAMMIEEWKKELHRINSWAKDISEAYKRFHLGLYMKEYMLNARLLTEYFVLIKGIHVGVRQFLH